MEVSRAPHRSEGQAVVLVLATILLTLQGAAGLVMAGRAITGPGRGQGLRLRLGGGSVRHHHVLATVRPTLEVAIALTALVLAFEVARTRPWARGGAFVLEGIVVLGLLLAPGKGPLVVLAVTLAVTAVAVVGLLLSPQAARSFHTEAPRDGTPG